MRKSIRTLDSVGIILMLRKWYGTTVVYLHFQESVLLRDRLCNFLLYKAVFLFGILNSVVHEEVIAWVLWFALLASVAALQSIIAYKLKYVRLLTVWGKNCDFRFVTGHLYASIQIIWSNATVRFFKSFFLGKICCQHRLSFL